MTRFLTIVVAAGAAMVLNGGQTTSSCPTCPGNSEGGKAMRWYVPIRTLPIQADALQINLNGAATPGSWRVAARIKAGAEAGARMQVAELEMETNVSGRPPIPASIVSYDDREVALKPGSAEIWLRPGAAHKHTVIYIELPRPLTIEVAANHQPLVRATVADSLYVIDGKLVAEKVTGFASVLSRAAFGSPRATAGVQRLGPNSYFAPPAEAVNHLARFTKPGKYASALPEGTSVSLLLTIGPEGDVKDVRGIRGDPRLVEHCRAAVQNWRFTPFLFRNSPVSVSTTVLMVLNADGNIMIPMFGGQ